MSTATDLTREHYQRAEVKETILNHALLQDGTWRAINGDFYRWYRYSDDGQARLLNAKKDYDYVTSKDRTLYQTLNVFDPSLWMISRPKDEITSDNPLGTPADTVAYTLGVDIDKGHGYDIEDPETRKAVETAAQFLVDYLKAHSIHKSVWVLFSGGGIYVEIHHEICKPTSKEDRAEFFELVTDRYNRLIEHVSEEFFRVHPEYVGKVKFDALNNSKRVFKCILSIHKKRPYAVVPLVKDAIQIDLERARLPIKEDVLDEARRWYSTYDPAEREPLLRLLDEFKEPEEEARQKSKRQFKEIWTSVFKVDAKYFPPCIRHIRDAEHPGEGKTRFSAILSTFLYQMGWPEEEAWNLVKKVSDRNGLPNADHIFDSCFGRISCPSCQKIQTDAAGYPHLGLKGLGVCKPDETCKVCQWPGDYTLFKSMDELSSQKELTLEQLTKATGKMVKINPDTGEKELDENGKPILIPKRTLSPSKATRVITSTMLLRTSDIDASDKPKIWRYDSGIWKPDGEKEIIKKTDIVIGDLSYEKGLRETLRRIRAQIPIASFDGNPYLFPTLDGVVELETGLFRAARPEDYLTFRYNATFNLPGADYRLFLWFLCSSLPDLRDVLTVLDIITAIAIRVPFDIIVLLFGGGSNGKGKLEKVMLALFTMARATAIKLDEMKQSRFGPGALLNKDLWIVTEVETVKDAMSVLKSEATGEMIDADVKYGERIQGMPHAISILDANIAFDPGDDSHGRKRRWVKLDFPYTFGDEPGMRPIDRHLEEKLTRPEVLAGIARIIAARAPALIKSRKIYLRKGTQEQEDEYNRQRFSLNYFCKECLSKEWVDTETGPERLTTDKAYTEYLEYCKLFNVTTPAEKSPFGKYIKECFGVESVSTTENKISIRYYPGLYLVNSAKAAYAENKLNYSNYSTTTGKLQENDSEIAINKWITTATTGELLSQVVEEIKRMFRYIQDCKDPREISYENYLKFPVVPVVAVVSGQTMPVSKTTGENPPVVEENSPVVEPEPNCIEADLLRAEELTRQKEAHDGELAEKHTKKTDPSHTSCLSCGDPIGPGHGTYFETFCGSCGPKLAMVRPAVKAHPDGFTLSGLWEDLAARGGRPPRKEHLPGMLLYLGYIEDGSVWRLPKSPAEPDLEQVGAEA